MKKKNLKEHFKIPLKERRKLEKIELFKEYVIKKKFELEKNKFLIFD